MLLLFLIVVTPLCWAVDVRPLPTENEVPQVVGSEVKVLPALPGGTEVPTAAPPAPAFSEPSAATESTLAPKLETISSSESSISNLVTLSVQANTTLALVANSEQSTLSTDTSISTSSHGSTTTDPFADITNVTLAPGAGSGSGALPASSPRVEFEPNVTSSIEPQAPKNLSAPIDGEHKNQTKLGSELPKAQNESLIDSKPKNESSLIPDLLSNSNVSANLESNLNISNPANAKFLLPTKIAKLRLTVIGFTGKPVHTFNLSEHQVLYQMKIFWGEPDSWQDIGYQPSDRLFELFCWLTTNGGFGRDLFRGNLSASLITHSQWYAFPETEDNSTSNISANCGIRPVNGAGKSGDWSFSDPAPIHDAPVFLRGFENVNVRGWTKEEVVRLVRNQKRHDQAPVVAKAAAAKTKAKSKKANL